MISYSPNMLKTFQTCPQKFLLKYEEKLIMPQKATYFEKGKNIHAIANYYLRGDNIDKFLQVLTPEESKLWSLLQNNEYFQKKYVESEYNLSCKIDAFWIGGRIDAIVKDENSYYILDYKTGAIPKNPEYDLQTIVYLLCLSKHLNKIDGINFVYIDLKNNQNHIIKFSQEKKLKYEKDIIEICNAIKNARPLDKVEYSKKCEFCEYKRICF